MPGVLGLPTDVQTRPGVYEGYEVYFGCENDAYRDLSVVFVGGIGIAEFSQFGNNVPYPLSEGERKFWLLSAAERVVAKVSSIHPADGVPPCRTDGWAIGFDINDYRKVDVAIRRLGLWLARENLKGEVALRVRADRSDSQPLRNRGTNPKGN
jgi:hypothetical protein